MLLPAIIATWAVAGTLEFAAGGILCDAGLSSAAIAGLLGQIAYADHHYAPEEERRIRDELGRVHGLTAAGVDAICDVLREHVVEIASVEAPWHARALRELAAREQGATVHAVTPRQLVLTAPAGLCLPRTVDDLFDLVLAVPDPGATG